MLRTGGARCPRVPGASGALLVAGAAGLVAGAATAAVLAAPVGAAGAAAAVEAALARGRARGGRRAVGVDLGPAGAEELEDGGRAHPGQGPRRVEQIGVEHDDVGEVAGRAVVLDRHAAAGVAEDADALPAVA